MAAATWADGSAAAKSSTAQRSLRASHVAVRSMRELAASSYGPTGRSKIIQAGAAGAGGALTVTTTSHRLFGALSLDDPLARVLLQLLEARQERGADGGLFTVMLAAGLVLGATERGLPARLCALLLPAALSQCLRAVLDGEHTSLTDCSSPRSPPAAVPIRMSQLPCLLAMVRAVLQPKHVAVPDDSEESVPKLALLLVESFVTSLADDGAAADAADPADAAGAADDDAIKPSAAERRAAAVLPGENGTCLALTPAFAWHYFLALVLATGRH